MPPSRVSTSSEPHGCVEGVLVEIEHEEQTERQALEVCLADDEGAEQDLIIWEEVLNEGETARAFQITVEPAKESVEKAVQTEPEGEHKSLAGLFKGVP